jgi:hypothetical protein
MLHYKTNNYLDRIEKRGLNIPIDTQSKLYRKCLSCDYEFMTNRSQEVFCCKMCKDDLGNYIKKIKMNILDYDKIRYVYYSADESIRDGIEIIKGIYKNKKSTLKMHAEELLVLGLEFINQNRNNTEYNYPYPIDKFYFAFGNFKIFPYSNDTYLVLKF